MAKRKAPKHKHCLILGTCYKHVGQFTDLTPTIYWYAKRAKLTLFIYSSTRYNQCLCMFLYDLCHLMSTHTQPLIIYQSNYCQKLFRQNENAPQVHCFT